MKSLKSIIYKILQYKVEFVKGIDFFNKINKLEKGNIHLERITWLPRKEVDWVNDFGERYTSREVDFEALQVPKYWSGDEPIWAFNYRTRDYTREFSSDNWMDTVMNILRDILEDEHNKGYDGVGKYYEDGKTTYTFKFLRDQYALSFYKSRGRVDTLVNEMKNRPMKLSELSGLFIQRSTLVIEQYNNQVDNYNYYIKNKYK